MQKIKIISIFFILFLFQNIYAQTEKIIIDKESEYYLQIDKDNCLKIIISDSSNKTSKIINFYKNNGDNSFLYIGSMESISLEMGDYGEGLQFIYKSNNFIVIQQSFGIGRNLIISRLYLDFENENTIKLIKYTEEHINRFDIDKDFTEIEYEIPNNIYLNDITSDFVYNLHQSKNQWNLIFPVPPRAAGAFYPLWKQGGVENLRDTNDITIIEGTDGIEQSRYEKPNQADNVHSFPPVLSGPIRRKK